MPLARGLLIGRGRRYSTLKLYVWSILGTTSLMALVAAGVSKSYWGYWFRRPNVLPEAKSLVSVDQVVAVTTGEPASTKFQIDDSYAKDDAYLPDDYYFLDERHWVTLVENGVLPADFSFEQELGLLTNFYQQLSATELLATPTPGYEDNAQYLEGVVTIGTTANGEQLALASLKGGQMSNDHYPYYEMVFHIDPATQALTFVRGQRFFYDLAGLEGAEWPALWILFTVVALSILLPALALGPVLKAIKTAREQYSR